MPRLPHEADGQGEGVLRLMASVIDEVQVRVGRVVSGDFGVVEFRLQTPHFALKQRAAVNREMKGVVL
jgi:hypothetical protein